MLIYKRHLERYRGIKYRIITIYIFKRRVWQSKKKINRTDTVFPASLSLL